MHTRSATLQSSRGHRTSNSIHNNGTDGERRPSVGLHIPGDLVDETGQALITPEIHFPASVQPGGALGADIAPWEEPPSPPPKATKSFGFSQKSSFASLNSVGLLGRSHHRPSQASTFSESTLGVAGPSSSTLDVPYHTLQPPELKKQKSSMFSSIMKKRSKGRLRSDSGDREKHQHQQDQQHPSLRPVAPQLPDSLVSILPIGSSGSVHSSLQRTKKRTKDSQNGSYTPSSSFPVSEDGVLLHPPPPPPPKDPELKLDTNFDDIDRIVDRSYSQQQGQIQPKPGQHGKDNSSDRSAATSTSLSSIAHSEFHNPFATQEPQPPRLVGMYSLMSDQKVSPKTIIGSSEHKLSLNGQVNGVNGKGKAPDVNGHGGEATIDPSLEGEQRSPSWIPPESWAVEKDGEEDPVDGYSSSEDSVLGAGGGRPLRFSKVRRSNSLSEDSPGASGTDAPPARQHRHHRLKQTSAHTNPPTTSKTDLPPKRPNSSASTYTTGTLSSLASGERKWSAGAFNGAAFNGMAPIVVGMKKRKKSKAGIPELVDGAITPRRPSTSHGPSHQKQQQPQQAQQPPQQAKNYTIRIYRHNQSYHMVQVGFQVTVANLIPRLNAKLLLGEDRESHRLYLKERGRERILANTERPADIVRRRLEQAGYDPSDCQDIVAGDGLLFLLKFVYKSQRLGPEEDLGIENFTGVNLSSRGLVTIPVPLHKHADMIISLNLARNPMLEIPLDFIQSCTSLRDLRLSNMALKKVPHSVRHSTSLHELDISCNRIADLDEALLDNIPALDALLMQNNRMEKLPWYFPRLRSLVKLNISNNKFKELPSVVCELENLRDLDISFNLINELPEDLPKLKSLERFTMVGNKVKDLPPECAKLSGLLFLDCRRNHITDISVACSLPRLEKLHADHNRLHALDLALGERLAELDVSHNEITQLSLIPGPVGAERKFSLTSLDISHAHLYWLDEVALAQLTSLQHLRLDHNQLSVVPESLGELQHLESLSCADNGLKELPKSIGKLQRLRVLDCHANSLTSLPDELWFCGALGKINATSNLIVHFHTPSTMHNVNSAVTSGLGSAGSGGLLPVPSDAESDRKASLTTGAAQFPLINSLERLYLGENQFTDDVLPPLMLLRELRVLNLSFNDISELPSAFFKNHARLEELYASGNKLTSIPTEDLHRLTRLSVLFLNGNRLQTLPHELGKVKALTVLDVGSNLLKYNINNWEFDWNWNFNKNLKYLNLSGNKKLQIKSDVTRPSGGSSRHSRDLVALAMLPRQSLAGFTELTNLRVLGLMDVTITATGMRSDIPDETDDRRVRTSMSTINGMAYGIADTLGKNDHLHMLDLVHEFPGRKGEAVFAMFGRSEPPKNLNVAGITHTSNRLARFLHDHFIPVFLQQLGALKVEEAREDPKDALRRSFLHLNQELHDFLFSTKVKRKMSGHSGTSGGSSSHKQQQHVVDHPTLRRTGASGVVLYFVGKQMYVANAGNALAVVSRGGNATLLSRKHDPYDREETARIRAAEGWISPPGLVNDEMDLSRSFGFFHLLPMVNARPDVRTWDLSELDEFVIVANRGLWDYVSYQTAVDIARREQGDPMIAAQKLRDFAVSYGASGSTMIMVIAVGDLFQSDQALKGSQNNSALDSYADPMTFKRLPPRRPRVQLERDDIVDRGIRRLPMEVAAPTGHIALVFTDIRNSTHLWEVNPGMPTAMRLHNNLLRRQLRFCGGYEVKTEGDSFMCSFPSALSALWWCLIVQVQLLHEPWPLEILEAPDGMEIRDLQNKIIAKGLSVRMGIHCGEPFCEPDPITKRMDYIGPMVNRAARIESRAAGGEIMCSADVIREIDAKIFGTGAETQFSDLQAPEAIDAIKRLGVLIVPVGEIKLKGLETPEMLSKVYPSDLEGRRFMEETPGGERDDPSGSRIPFSVDQMRELGMLCLRLEALAQNRIFRPLSERKGSQALSFTTEMSVDIEGEDNSAASDPSVPSYLYSDPAVLLPPMNENSSDADMMAVMDSLAGRIGNAITSIARKNSTSGTGTTNAADAPPTMKEMLASALGSVQGLDSATLAAVFSAMEGLKSPP